MKEPILDGLAFTVLCWMAIGFLLFIGHTLFILLKGMLSGETFYYKVFILIAFASATPWALKRLAKKYIAS